MFERTGLSVQNNDAHDVIQYKSRMRFSMKSRVIEKYRQDFKKKTNAEKKTLSIAAQQLVNMRANQDPPAATATASSPDSISSPFQPSTSILNPSGIIAETDDSLQPSGTIDDEIVDISDMTFDDMASSLQNHRPAAMASALNAAESISGPSTKRPGKGRASKKGANKKRAIEAPSKPSWTFSTDDIRIELAKPGVWISFCPLFCHSVIT